MKRHRLQVSFPWCHTFGTGTKPLHEHTPSRSWVSHSTEALLCGMSITACLAGCAALLSAVRGFEVSWGGENSQGLTHSSSHGEQAWGWSGFHNRHVFDVCVCFQSINRDLSPPACHLPSGQASPQTAMLCREYLIHFAWRHKQIASLWPADKLFWLLFWSLWAGKTSAHHLAPAWGKGALETFTCLSTVSSPAPSQDPFGSPSRVFCFHASSTAPRTAVTYIIPAWDPTRVFTSRGLKGSLRPGWRVC